MLYEAKTLSKYSSDMLVFTELCPRHSLVLHGWISKELNTNACHGKMSWLFGCFGFSDPLNERKIVQTTCTYCKRSWLLPCCNLNMLDAPALKVYPAPSHHSSTPTRYVVCENHIANLTDKVTWHMNFVHWL